MFNVQWLVGCFLAAAPIAAGQQPQQPLSTKQTLDDAFLSQQPHIDNNDINDNDPGYTPLFAFHRDLVNINSISGNEHAIGIYLEEYLLALNYTIERQVVPPIPQSSSSPGPRFNILAHPPSYRSTPILLTTHIDTVPPFYPYSSHPHPNSTLLRGRGAVDAKASIATQIHATQSLLSSRSIPPHSISFLFVTGEEIGGDGMRLASRSLNLRPSPRAVIFGEPTQLKLASGHMGILIFRLKVRGRAAHSGYPWLGASATQVLVRALAALEEMELPWSEKYGNSTLNIGMVKGGVAANVVAESAEAAIGLRLAGGEVEGVKRGIVETVAKAVGDGVAVTSSTAEENVGDVDGADAVAPNAPKASIEVFFSPGGYPPVDIDHDIPGFDTMTVNYGTDIPNLQLHGERQYKQYLYGPGSILVAHSDHEALTKGELVEAVGGYERIILHAVGELGL